MNIASLSAEENRFVLDVASLQATLGMPASAGRMFGYLLLQNAPVSLDQLAQELEMSKGGAWNAARLLERYGNARRYGEPGSKRALYGPPDRFSGAVSEQISFLGDFEALLQRAITGVAQGGAASRLTDMARFYRALRLVLETTIREFDKSRAAAQAASAGRNE
jgi:hypothetical protein